MAYRTRRFNATFKSYELPKNTQLVILNQSDVCKLRPPTSLIEEGKSAFKMFKGKRPRPIGRPRRRWEDNIRIALNK